MGVGRKRSTGESHGSRASSLASVVTCFDSKLEIRSRSAGEVVSAVGAGWGSFDIGYDSDEQEDHHSAVGLGRVVQQPCAMGRSLQVLALHTGLAPQAGLLVYSRCLIYNLLDT